MDRRSKKVVSAQVPAEVARAIDVAAELRGETRSAFIRHATARAVTENLSECGGADRGEAEREETV